MADHKFTLEEILNEYSADGKRSGIRHTSEQPLSRGTLETEKLVNAATSERPLSRERAGYDTVAPPPENTKTSSCWRGCCASRRWCGAPRWAGTSAI